MSNTSCLKGVGSRLDQLQIERALQLGIKNVPRISRPNATLYHTKMGFLPIKQELERVKSLHSLNVLVKSVKHIWENYSPIIFEKNGKFFLDINTSRYMMNLNKCKEIIKKHNKKRIDNLDGNNTLLSFIFNYLLSYHYHSAISSNWKQWLFGH